MKRSSCPFFLFPFPFFPFPFSLFPFYHFWCRVHVASSPGRSWGWVRTWALIKMLPFQLLSATLYYWYYWCYWCYWYYWYYYYYYYYYYYWLWFLQKQVGNLIQRYKLQVLLSTMIKSKGSINLDGPIGVYVWFIENPNTSSLTVNNLPTLNSSLIGEWRGQLALLGKKSKVL